MKETVENSSFRRGDANLVEFQKMYHDFFKKFYDLEEKWRFKY